MARPNPIEALVRAEEWAAARKAIKAALTVEPDDHWLLTRLGLTYYEQRDYSASLECSERARKLAPGCPLILWDHAGTLRMLGRHRKALGVYRSLYRIDQLHLPNTARNNRRPTA